MSLFDISGKLVQQDYLQFENVNRIKLDTLSNGLYFLELKKGDRTFHYKVIKQ